MKIKIQPGAIILIAFFIWDKNFARLLLSVILHECGHSLAAFIMGKRNQLFTVTPFGCALYTGELEGRLRSLFVYAAGPLTSLALLPLLRPQTLWVFIFNMIPLLPLDGGRILHVFVSERQTNLTGGLCLLCLLWFCFFRELNPIWFVVILLLHRRYLAYAQLIKIKRSADFFRDLY